MFIKINDYWVNCLHIATVRILAVYETPPKEIVEGRYLTLIMHDGRKIEGWVDKKEFEQKIERG